MKILGIDQSYTSSGVVLLEKGELKEAHKFSANKETNRFAQAYEIALHLAEFVDEHKPDIIAIEGLAFGMRGNVTRDLGGLQFVIISHLQEVKKRDVEIVAPTSVKKFATGSGRAKKEEMIDSLPETVYNYFTELGLKKSTGLADMADAYWIAKAAEANNIEG
jgi:crossover junction endodeoxyribonuclease RuvC